jgi:hypothetical protein
VAGPSPAVITHGIGLSSPSPSQPHALYFVLNTPSHHCDPKDPYRTPLRPSSFLPTSSSGHTHPLHLFASLFSANCGSGIYSSLGRHFFLVPSAGDGDELSKLLARGEGRFKLPFKVSRKEFNEWRSDKEEEIEEIGGFEYDSSLETIIIKADGGPLHERTVFALTKWLDSLASEHTEFTVSLGEGNVYLPRPSRT